MKPDYTYADLELWIPQYKYCLELLVDCLESRMSVTDIGIGSGNVAEHLLQINPHLNLYGVDTDAAALALAAERLGRYPYITLFKGDMRDVQLKPTELVVSALSIHHLEHVEQEAVFEKIYHALPPEGCFAHFEIVDWPSDWLRNRNKEYGISFPQNKGIPKEAINELLRRMEEKDKPLSYNNHQIVLEKLGFYTQKPRKLLTFSHGDEWVRSFYSLDFWYHKGRGLKVLPFQTPPFTVGVGALPALC